MQIGEGIASRKISEDAVFDRGDAGHFDVPPPAGGVAVPQPAVIAARCARIGPFTVEQAGHETAAGEQWQLRVSAADGGQLTNIAWSIQGTVPGSTTDSAIRGYTSGALRGEVHHLTTADLARETVTLCFVRSGTFVARVTALSNGRPVYSQRSFRVFEPRLDAWGVTTGAVGIRQDPDRGYYRLACGLATPGCAWWARLTGPTCCDGQFRYTQLVDLSIERHGTHSGRPVRERLQTAGFWLDHRDTFPAPHGEAAYPRAVPRGRTVEGRAEDWPSVPLRVDGRWDRYTLRFMHLKLWLMYRPTGDGSIWVPIAFTQWRWYGAADRRRGDEFTLRDGGHVWRDPRFAPSDLFPQWTDLYSPFGGRPAWEAF
jgi:hypothetical protein